MSTPLPALGQTNTPPKIFARHFAFDIAAFDAVIMTMIFIRWLLMRCV